MSILTEFKDLWKKRRIELIEIFFALVLLILSVPIFILYQYFPTISPEIGSHQIASWLSVTFAFIGFGVLVYNMGKLEM